jgi:Na+-driven multidrug efflux pump
LAFILWFFLSKNSELKITKCNFGLQLPIVKEIGSLGFVTLSRQAVVSVTYLLMNNILFDLGGETSVTAYAIVGRMIMFAFFPIYGITQGFLPIAGFNYGAGNYKRVRESITTAIKYAAALAALVFIFLMVFPEAITGLFTQDEAVLRETPPAMRYVFLATPIIAVQLIGAAYFQAIGKALPALILTLLRQGIFFIPLIFILPNFYGALGVWIAFPVADILATIVTAYFLHREVTLNLLSSKTK